MSEVKQITLPITGMTCAHCVVTIERNLKKLDGLQTAVVNLSSERGTVEYDPSVLSLRDIVTRVESVGYGVATGEAELAIKHLSDAGNAGRLEKALAKLEGVLDSQVSFVTQQARVKYVPTIVSQADIRRAIKAAGKARELKSSTDIVAAEKAGELKITQLALVINMPFVIWDGGKR